MSLYDYNGPPRVDTMEAHRLCRMVISPDPKVYEPAIKRLEDLLSTELVDAGPCSDTVESLIKDILDSGIGFRLVQLAGVANRPECQEDACRLLMDMTAGTDEQTHALVQLGSVPVFLRLLQSPTQVVCNNAAWAIFNISQGFQSGVDSVVKCGGVDAVIALLRASTATNRSLKLTAMMALSGLCQARLSARQSGKSPPLSMTTRAIRAIADALREEEDSEIIEYAFTGIEGLTDCPEQISAVIDAGLFEQILRLYWASSYNGRTIVQNIAAYGNIEHVHKLVQCNILQSLLHTLQQDRRHGPRSDVWQLVSGIAKSPAQVQAIIHGGLLEPLVADICNHRTSEFPVTDALHAIARIILTASILQLEHLLHHDLIGSVLELLSLMHKTHESKAVISAYAALNKIVKVARMRVCLIRSVLGSRNFSELVERADVVIVAASVIVSGSSIIDAAYQRVHAAHGACLLRCILKDL